MPVFRVLKTKDYSVMSNAHFKEKRMSLKAKGLLSLMLSLPDEWDYSIEGIAKLNSDGKCSVVSAMRELEKFGFLKRTRTKDKGGKFNDVVYDVYENTTINPKTDLPYIEKPDTEKLSAENQTQLNTNISNTKQLYTDNDNAELLPDLDSAKIYIDFENEFDRSLSVIETERINEWLKKHKPELIEEALKRSVLHNVKTFQYIGSILANWETNSIKCMDDVVAADKKRKEERNRKKTGIKENKQIPRHFIGDRAPLRDEDIYELY